MSETLYIQHFNDEARGIEYYEKKMSGYTALKKVLDGSLNGNAAAQPATTTPEGKPVAAKTKQDVLQEFIINEVKKSNLRGRAAQASRPA